MRIQNDTKLDFDDVLLVPQRSSLSSRSEVQVEREFRFVHSPQIRTFVPIIVSNMDTIGTFEIAKEVCKDNILVALHKYYSAEEIAEFLGQNNELRNNVFVTIGLGDYDKLRNISDILGEEISMICLDVANAYTDVFVENLEEIRHIMPDAIIMAGSVCTGNMTEELILSGADIVRVGVGSGSICTTRQQTGIGFSQLSAIDECAFNAHGLGGHICADGGIGFIGDASKAFSAGADFIMCGSMFAGADECEGSWITNEDGEKFFRFYGLASRKAQELHSGGVKDYAVAEGREILVPAKGPIREVVKSLLGGIRSCCTYSGARRIKDLPKCAEFVRISR